MKILQIIEAHVSKAIGQCPSLHLAEKRFLDGEASTCRISDRGCEGKVKI